MHSHGQLPNPLPGKGFSVLLGSVDPDRDEDGRFEIVVGAEPWSLFGISVVDPRSAEGELVRRAQRTATPPIEVDCRTEAIVRPDSRMEWGDAPTPPARPVVGVSAIPAACTKL